MTPALRMIHVFSLLVLILVACLSASAQMETATLSGVIQDPKGAVVPDVEITATRIETSAAVTTKTNGAGIYAFTSLLPGHYHLIIRGLGFKEIVIKELELHVQEKLEQNFSLEIGSVSETVTVTAGAPLVNTTDGSVSTVVDHTYVENMPMNGRSFQDLILLTPGVVTNSPQMGATTGVNGEFSVNGQRTESNYYTVDGVSANFGTALGNYAAPGNSGALPASTVLGTTQGLVSIDALQEFRVQSSSYSAEFGRSPGGQFGFVTRSGTNDWYGTAFDYLRNNVFDANDWFNNYFQQPQPALRQNDFGGTLGGPVEIPAVYDGKGKTFFFFSAEALRLLQPQAASVTYVPTVTLRQSSSGPLQQVLNAFPLPNCPSAAGNCSNDLGDGLGQFIGTWSNPSSIDSYSIRLDQVLNQRFRLFFRFSDTASSQNSRIGGLGFPPPSVIESFNSDVRTYTFGLTTALSAHVVNDFRLNYSSNETTATTRVDNFGGARPVDLAELQGISTPYSSVQVFLAFSNFSQIAAMDQAGALSLQRQWNLVDSTSWSLGKHQLKFGIDYRTLSPVQGGGNTRVIYEFFDSQSVQANSPAFAEAQTQVNFYPHFVNFSAFAQDEWRARPRLNLSFGLRWDVNPAPTAPKGNLPYTVQGDINDPSTVTLAPEGTSLWHTTWHNVAPRWGAAYMLRDQSGSETVIRAGAGVFFDTGQQLGTQGYGGPGFTGIATYCPPPACTSPASFPLTSGQISPPIVNPPVPPVGYALGVDPHLQLPFTVQWNASIEQALGISQALTISYVGANARRLLQFIGVSTPSISEVDYVKNGLTSDYNALQLQYKRRLRHGLQALASFTWSHSIDYGSQDIAVPYKRGDSDFDVRHNFSAAASYEVPNALQNSFARVVLHRWGVDGRFTARAGFPVTLNGPFFLDQGTGQYFYGGLDLVPGQPLYLSGSQCLQAPPAGYGNSCPGGRAINPNAFALPPAGQFGDAPRNFVRGFGAWQMDLAVRREFPIHERLKLQFRAEAFNIFNHPNFGSIDSNYGDPTFGQATATLASSLGVLSPLYQQGGPRSMQFALKLIF